MSKNRSRTFAYCQAFNACTRRTEASPLVLPIPDAPRVSDHTRTVEVTTLDVPRGIRPTPVGSDSRSRWAFGVRRPLTFTPIATVLPMAMLPAMLEHDRKQAGWSVGQAAWRLSVIVREYREIETGERVPAWDTWNRICRLFGWPQTFASGIRR